ncbi:hypothetical protein MMC26_004258 [Xylographa opegraphella]|nr:hypothetical protein [Xylographa opegraphella]
MQQITVFERQYILEHGRGSWIIDVSINGESFEQNLKLEDPFTPEDEAECRWYLESFAPKSPFELTRAKRIAEKLDLYATQLGDGIRLLDLVSRFPRLDQPQYIELEVVEGYPDAKIDSPDASIQRLHWELLENCLRHSEGPWPISVTRSIRNENKTCGIKKVTSWAVEKASDGPRNSFNILLVVARNLTFDESAHQDVDPGLTLRALLAIKRHLKVSNAPYELNVEVVRPGTFNALQEHLQRATEEHGPGYFNLVHFDMHGIIGSHNGSYHAWLMFANASSWNKMKPVRSGSIGRLLKKYDISIAVLNACESARPNKGMQANLARSFIEEGVTNVLAMAYKTMSSAAPLFLRAFYQALFLEHAPFSRAVSQARVSLRDHPKRAARCGIEVDLRDWSVPVAYVANGVNIRIMSALNTPFEAIEAIPQVMSASSERGVVGRDYEKLRFERQLLETKSVYLHGPAGSGKTQMLIELYREWEETGFMDHCFYVDCTALPNFNIFMALVIIDTELDESETTCNSKAKITPEKIADLSAIRELLDRIRNKRVVLILDAMDEHHPIKVNYFPFYNVESFDDKKAACNRSTADSFFVACRTLPTLFTIVVGRQDQTWLQTQFPNFRASTFELAGLDLPSAIDYSEMILEKRLIPRSRNGTEADALVHIINLLQRLPLALEMFLSSPFKEASLYDIYQDLINGRGLAATLSKRPRYYINGTARFLRSLPKIYDDKHQKIFYLCLASFWRLGPYDGFTFYSEPGSKDPYTGVGTSFALRKLDAAGVIKVSGKCVSWIHPLWTLYIRFKLHDSSYVGGPFECIAWHELSIRARFMYDVSDGLLQVLKPVVEHVHRSGSDFTTVKAVIRESFPNFLTCLQFCTSRYPTIPLNSWPINLFLVYPNHARFGLSISEQILLAEGLEKLLERFIELNGGMAVSQENGLHLFAIVLCVLLCSTFHRNVDFNQKKAQRFTNLGIQFHEASVLMYGQPSPEILPPLAGLYTWKVVDLLRSGNTKEAGEWREKALGLKRKFTEASCANKALLVQGRENTSEYARLMESMDLPWSLMKISMEGDKGWQSFHQMSFQDENELFVYLYNLDDRREMSVHVDETSPCNDTLEVRIRKWFYDTRSKQSAINHLEEAIDIGAWSQAMRLHLSLGNESTNQGDHMQALMHAERALSIGKQNLPLSASEVRSFGLMQEILAIFGEDSTYKPTWKATIESIRSRTSPLIKQLGEDGHWRPLAKAFSYVFDRTDSSGKEFDKAIDQCRALLGDEGAENLRSKTKQLWKYADELEAEEAAERVAEEAARVEEEARQQREAENVQVLLQEHMEKELLPMVRSAGRNDIADVMKRYIDISQRLTEVDDAEIKDLLLNAAKVFPPHVVSLWRLTLSASRAIALSVEALQLLPETKD